MQGKSKVPSLGDIRSFVWWLYTSWMIDKRKIKMHFLQLIIIVIRLPIDLARIKLAKSKSYSFDLSRVRKWLDRGQCGLHRI